MEWIKETEHIDYEGLCWVFMPNEYNPNGGCVRLADRGKDGFTELSECAEEMKPTHYIPISSPSINPLGFTDGN